MKIHLVAICGTGMGALAGLLKEAGHEVRGSDRAFYPPMGEALADWGIPTMEGFDPAHIGPDTELVIVGNACRKDNPEARAASERGLRLTSFPQALEEMFLTSRRSLTVAGTHGKTTTSALLAQVLVACGRDPSFLVGGIPLNFGRSFRLGKGRDFVIEGDEYDTAFFDKRPKFVHYQPKLAVLTSVEYDHADIYPDMDAYRAAFRLLIELLPADGLLVAALEDPEVAALAAAARCPVVGYGFAPELAWRAVAPRAMGSGMVFELEREGRPAGRLDLPLSGRHNVANALAVLAVCAHIGLEPERVAEAWAGFQGVARRLQERGTVGGVTVLDDFAHHPTEVAATVQATRERYPGRELVAVFEPRTNTSRRRVFQQQYPAAFAGADRVIVVPPFGTENLPSEERFDSDALVARLVERGQRAERLGDVDGVVAALGSDLAPGAVVLIMSNGAFGGIHGKLLAALGARAGGHA